MSQDPVASATRAPLDDTLPFSMQPNWTPPLLQHGAHAGTDAPGTALVDDSPPAVDISADVQVIWDTLLADDGTPPGHNVFRDAVRGASIRMSNGRIRELWHALRTTVPPAAPAPNDPVTLAEAALVVAQRATGQLPELFRQAQAEVNRCVTGLATWERGRLIGDGSTMDQKAALLEAKRLADDHLQQVLPALRAQLDAEVTQAQATLARAQTARTQGLYNEALTALQADALEYNEALDDVMARHRALLAQVRTLASLGHALDLAHLPVSALAINSYLLQQTALVTAAPARVAPRLLGGTSLPARLQSPKSLYDEVHPAAPQPVNPLAKLADVEPLTEATTAARAGTGNVWAVRGSRHPSLMECGVQRPGYFTQNAFIAGKPIELTREEWARVVAQYQDARLVDAPELPTPDVTQTVKSANDRPRGDRLSNAIFLENEAKQQAEIAARHATGKERP